MPKSNANLALKGLDEMFSTEESRQEQKREQVQQIPIEELFPFKEHPFKVLDDEAMQRTVESVAQYGILAPLIARPRPEGGNSGIRFVRRINLWTFRALSPDSSATTSRAFAPFNLWPIWPQVKSDLAP